MSPNRKRNPPPARAPHGFTLTEVLVALAIFITVISGVFALYGGAIETVRRGNQAMSLFADGRVTLKVLEEDLKIAYTGRDFGDPNQFFGRPEGFMFVGKLSTGTEGRVTYVINPNAAPDSFTTILAETWDDTRARVWREVYDAAYNLDLPDALGTGAGDGAAKVFAEQTAKTIAGKGNINSVFVRNFPRDATTAETDVYEFPVRAESYALMRYEEPDRNDLDSFDLPVLPNGDPMTWPILDPENSDNDLPPRPVEGTPDGDLYYFLKSALGDRSHEPTAPVPVNGDMRDLVNSVFSAGNIRSYIPASQSEVVPQLNSITPTIVKNVIANKRREFWIRLLADDPSIVQPDANVNPDAHGFAPRFWTNDPSLASNTTAPKYIKDHVLTERILNRAALQVDGQDWVINITSPAGDRGTSITLDALKVPGIFSYCFDKSELDEITSDGDANTKSSYMNAFERMDDYKNFYNDPGPVTLTGLDDALNIMQANGGNSPIYAGTPLVPRLPALVQARFWISDEKVLLNAPDFRRLFVQLFDVPSGAGSGVSDAVRALQQAQP